MAEDLTDDTDRDAVAAAPQRSAPTALMEPQQAFAELGHLVVGETPLHQVLTRVAELAKACVPGADDVSVTLLEGEKARSAAFTGALAASLDERQYEAGFGPCVHAATGGQVVRVDDTGHEDVYPDFAAIAARQGVRSTISVGMPMPQRLLGGINVYRFDEGALDEEAVQLLQVFAGYAAIAVANHALYDSAVALSGNLQIAMQSRAVIEQAKGVLVASLRCTPDEAFAHLARQSQHSNRKLRDIAAEIVERAGGGHG
ncbi:ANTAR domain-containing protein [Kineococcus sp. SYSU DK006]|uniref:ANTAR domain-containing protein n=1 Tax=Kineococcus sp. SYSU DK006 TaxID=3383127 RepID=UPI003D7EF818